MMTPRDFWASRFPDPETIAAHHARHAVLADELVAASGTDAPLPVITAFIMAGDRLSAGVAEEMVRAGVPFDQALIHVGSYAVVDWALRMYEAGFTKHVHLLHILPGLWSGSDPDDTDPRFLWLWEKAWRRNGTRTILSDPGNPLPLPAIGGTSWLTVYRGQDAGAKPGIAWTLDEAVARKFANGAALRVGYRPNPEVMKAVVRPRKVLAYLTGRGESEVIVDPLDLR